MGRLRVVSSESVGRGHPDKICDSISDAIVDEVLKYDSHGRVAIETTVKGNVVNCPFATEWEPNWEDSGLMKYNGVVTLLGEVSAAYNLLQKTNLDAVVQSVIKKIGYVDDAGFNKNCFIVPLITGQSPDIAQGVEREYKEQGAGDQGLMWGYAANETKEFMPLGITLAHRLVERLEEVRNNGTLPYLRPDCKSQVAVIYDEDKVIGLKNVVIAASHLKTADMKQLRNDVLEQVVLPVCEELVTPDTLYFINGTGRFEIYGPTADSGLTGRKIIVDTYGGIGRHGGGAFSGKDPSKVDRSGAYMARYIAKNIVASGLASKCEVQLSYCIGVADPTSVFIDTMGTGKVGEEKLEKAIKEIVPLKPGQIIERFNLKTPQGWCYYDTAAYGHFGRDKFPWEKTDIARDIYFLARK